MAREGYALRTKVLGAHSVGANHIRQRLYWGASRLSNSGLLRSQIGKQQANGNIECGDINGLAENSASLRRRGRDNADPAEYNRQIQAQGLGDGIGLADSDSQRCDRKSVPDEQRTEMLETSGNDTSSLSPWSDSAFILCRDTDKQGRHRVRRVPAESILQRVADGVPEELDELRYQSICESPEKGFPLCKKGSIEGQNMLLAGYGNAIVPQCGAAFIEEFLESINAKELT